MCTCKNVSGEVLGYFSSRARDFLKMKSETMGSKKSKEALGGMVRIQLKHSQPGDRAALCARLCTGCIDLSFISG